MPVGSHRLCRVDGRDALLLVCTAAHGRAGGANRGGGVSVSKVCVSGGGGMHNKESTE